MDSTNGTTIHLSNVQIREARVRVAAAQRLLEHGLGFADVYSLSECAEAALVLTSQAQYLLDSGYEVVPWAA